TVENGYIVFKTDHFSDWAIVQHADITIGDVNGDGNINSSDALMVLQHSVGLETLTGDRFTAADVNRDTVINSSDALMILQYSVGNISKF
ncbi:MAG: dockerin type I repeat-containing protein, partial [Clostridia bacterium]|nr:dockerin type I repeat-containing protein [Clostridia bacterium]